HFQYLHKHIDPNILSKLKLFERNSFQRMMKEEENRDSHMQNCPKKLNSLQSHLKNSINTKHHHDLIHWKKLKPGSKKKNGKGIIIIIVITSSKNRLHNKWLWVLCIPPMQAQLFLISTLFSSTIIFCCNSIHNTY